MFDVVTQMSSIEKLLHKYRAKEPTRQTKGKPIPKSPQSSVAQKLMDKQPWQYPGWKKQSELLYRKGHVKGLNPLQREEAETTSTPILRAFVSDLKLVVPPDSGIGTEKIHQQPLGLLTDHQLKEKEPEYWLKNPKLEKRNMPMLTRISGVRRKIHNPQKAADIEKKLHMPHGTIAKGLRRLEEWEFLVQSKDRQWSLHPTILTNLLLEDEWRKMFKSGERPR